jgi:hypothetical protein
LTNGFKEIIFKIKIKEKNKLNCEAIIVDSFAKYISFDIWVNRNVFKKKKRPNHTRL